MFRVGRFNCVFYGVDDVFKMIYSFQSFLSPAESERELLHTWTSSLGNRSGQGGGGLVCTSSIVRD